MLAWFEEAAARLAAPSYHPMMLRLGRQQSLLGVAAKAGMCILHNDLENQNLVGPKL
jgi:hypothetical protein